MSLPPYAFNTVSYLKLNFKLKTDPKLCKLKNLEKLGKPGKFFEKTNGNPENIFKVALQYLFNVFILFNTVSYLKLNI